MYWLARMKCRECAHEMREKPIDADTPEDAKMMTFDCPNCGGPGTLEVIADTLRTRYVV